MAGQYRNRVRIDLVRCSFFLLVTTLLFVGTSASAVSIDHTLKVFGNANMDDAIDEADIEYVQGVIDGTNEETELADANYDGEIDEEDIAQIELIIAGVETELTLIDGATRTVTVGKPVERIVVCFPHALETLRTLKVPKDNIVGAAKHWPEYDPGFFPEIGDIPDVGDRWDPNVEEILALKPDLVMFTASSAYSDTSSTISSLESVGVDVLCFSLNGLETYPEEIEELGYVLDKEVEAKEFVDWRGNILDDIEAKVDNIPENEKPRVYFEAASGDDGYKIYGEYAYIALCGGNDIFSDQPGSYTSVNPEAIAAREPDVIVKVESTAGGYDMDARDISEFEDTRGEVMSRKVLQYVPAVKEGRVYVIAVHLLSFFGDSGCRSFIQLAYQAKWFQPELFEDLDPKAIHQEYLTRFQGLDIDLDENGVFVYPLEETT
jgi:iron complex transport system substrate-binding protein